MRNRGVLPLAGFLGTLLIGVAGAHLAHDPAPGPQAVASAPGLVESAAGEGPLAGPEVTPEEASKRPTEVLRPKRGELPVERPAEASGKGPEPTPAPDPAGGDAPGDEPEPMPIPDDWCGTGRDWRRPSPYVDPQRMRLALQPRYGAWGPTDERGIYRRVVTRHDLTGKTVRCYQYGRRKNGVWVTWSREEERERRRRAGAPK